MARFCLFLFCVTINLFFFSALEAKAQDNFEDRHIRITADKPAIINLGEEAASVIIGNPAHATAVLDNAHTLIINPLRPGATSLVVLNENGAIVMEKQLLINPPARNYVRVNRICNSSTNEDCREMSLYYCAGGCYEMILSDADTEIDTADGEEGSEARNASEGNQPTNNMAEGYVE